MSQLTQKDAGKVRSKCCSVVEKWQGITPKKKHGDAVIVTFWNWSVWKADPSKVLKNGDIAG